MARSGGVTIGAIVLLTIGGLAVACGSVGARMASSGSGSGGSSSSTSSSSIGGTGGTGGGDAGPVEAGPVEAGADADAGDFSMIAAEVDAFCTSYGQALCAIAPSCGCVATPFWPGSVAACAKTVRASCLKNLHWIETSGIGFREDRATACVAWLQAAGTTACAMLNLPDAWNTCPDALAWPSPLGSSCTNSVFDDCAGGDGTCVNGTCVPHSAVGGTCAMSPSQCLRGAFCNASQVCQALGAQGDACAASVECAAGLSCNGSGVCDLPASGVACGSVTCNVGLSCTNSACQIPPASCGEFMGCFFPGTACTGVGTGTCAPVLGGGAACGLGQGTCGNGLSCEQGMLGGHCAPIPGAGQTCGYTCQPGLGCSVATQTCQPPPGVGQPCNLAPSTFQCAAGGCEAPVAECAPGLACSDPGNADGVCVQLPGPSCASDADCAPGDRCAPAGVCRTPVTVGDPCDAGTPCPSGAVCQGSLCHQVVGAGQVCPDNFAVCAPGLACVQGAQLGHGTCQAPPGSGQPCGLDEACAAGLGCQAGMSSTGLCEPSVCLL